MKSEKRKSKALSTLLLLLRCSTSDGQRDANVVRKQSCIDLTPFEWLRLAVCVNESNLHTRMPLHCSGLLQGQF